MVKRTIISISLLVLLVFGIGVLLWTSHIENEEKKMTQLQLIEQMRNQATEKLNESPYLINKDIMPLQVQFESIDKQLYVERNLNNNLSQQQVDELLIKVQNLLTDVQKTQKASLGALFQLSIEYSDDSEYEQLVDSYNEKILDNDYSAAYEYLLELQNKYPTQKWLERPSAYELLFD